MCYNIMRNRVVFNEKSWKSENFEEFNKVYLFELRPMRICSKGAVK